MISTLPMLNFLESNHHYLYTKLAGYKHKLSAINNYKRLVTGNYKGLNSLKIGGAKSSDTIFILGSGASINSYTTAEWNAIKSSDSLGFNFFVAHDFVPTYYAFETPQGHRRVQLFNIIKNKVGYYNNTIVIYRGKGILTSEEISLFNMENFFISDEEMLPGTTPESFEKCLRQYYNEGRFEVKNTINKIYKKRASLSYLVMLSLVAGYKNIVLCGVDLNSTQYFYETDYYENKFGKLITGQEGTIHRTNDSSIHPLTIEKVLHSINNIVLKENGVRLFIAKKTSALYPKLPIYFLTTI